MPTVLIVDDCPAVRTTLRSLLEQQVSPVMCIEASNGIDAIAQGRSISPGPNYSGFGHAGNEWI
jgi:DNA-binding NarL/FixJ family response regulator